MNKTVLQNIAAELNLPQNAVVKVIELLSEGATIPFLARYRKEVTGGMDEVQLANIKNAWKKGEELIKRKEFIRETIEEQGKLTEELARRIDTCWDPIALEDLYLPYKKRKKTRADKARDRGLEPLAKILADQRENNLRGACKSFLNAEVPTIEDALQGARDILAEWFNEDEQIRQALRQSFERYAMISSKPARGKKEKADKYRDYFEFSQRLDRAPSHRVLAIFRGENEGLLKMDIGPDPERTIPQLSRMVVRGRSAASEQVQIAFEDAYKRLLKPGIETEFKNSAKAIADAEAIQVFQENLKQLLLSAPLGEKFILGLDPGFRTGCKTVVIDRNGNLKHNTTIYPHPPQNKIQEAGEKIKSLIHKYKIEAIAIGNGTAGRETFTFCEGLQLDKSIQLFMVNESGASIYSASEIAREEFPDQDITVRGAVSIARRLADPLAELVKIDPKSIGVGQYQYDVNQTELKESLDRTVESCVNQVGININTASKHLLTYVSGLGPSLAQKVVEYREENGAFESRQVLKKVPRLGAKAFEQCAGFLRIRDAKNVLDNTAVHPERYALVKKMAKDCGATVSDLIQRKELRNKIDLNKYVSDEIGLPTLKDIMQELAKPGLDPRGEVKSFSFDPNVRSISDLKAGMRLPGLITNITNFGAFVDVGVKQDGLVHISQLADVFVKNPADHVRLNQEVMVRVLEVDPDRNRITLSMKQNA